MAVRSVPETIILGPGTAQGIGDLPAASPIHLGIAPRNPQRNPGTVIPMWSCGCYVDPMQGLCWLIVVKRVVIWPLGFARKES